MTDNGGGRDSGGGASWFKPSEDRHLRQSDYQDPLEGQEQQQEETVFPDSGGYAGLSSSRPALADPYPEALGGPPVEPPNPLSYPGAGEAAYRPLTRIPGEDTEPKTQEIPVLRPDSEPLWADTAAPGGAAPAGAERAPWEADGGDVTAGDTDLRAPAAPGYPDPDAGADPIGAPGSAWDADDRGGLAGFADAGEGRAPWEADRREPDPVLDGGRGSAWDAGVTSAEGDLRDPAALGYANREADPDLDGGPGSAWDADGRGSAAGFADAGEGRAPWEADRRGPDPDLDGGRGSAWDADGRGSAAGFADAGEGRAPWEADRREPDPDLDGGRGSAWDAGVTSAEGDLRDSAALGYANREADPDLDGARGSAWDADGPGEPAQGRSTAAWDADAGEGRAPWEADRRAPDPDLDGARGSAWDAGVTSAEGDLRDPAALGYTNREADPDLDGARGSAWDTDGREPWDADGRGSAAGFADPGEGRAPWEADRRAPDPDLDGGRGSAWDDSGTDLRGERAPWDAAGIAEPGDPAAALNDGPAPAWDTDADDLRDDRAPWGADDGPGDGRTPAWDAEDPGYGRGGGVDPLTDDSYGSRGADDRGSAWGPQADPLSDDRGTGWGDDPLGGEDRAADEGAAAGEEDPWGWSRNADGVPGPVRVPDSREERAAAPWTDVPEPDAWDEEEAPGATGNTWAFDRDDPRLPDVVREAERRRREESAAAEDPLAAIADMQSRARGEEPEATQMIAPVPEAPEEESEYEDGFTPADYGMPVKPKAKKRKKDLIAEEFPGFEDRPLGGEAGDPYPGYDSVDFLADTERGAVLTLWLGIASLIPGVGLVTALLALLVTGPKAKRAIRSSNGQLDGLGLITGGTVFAVLGILVTVISVAIWLLL